MILRGHIVDIINRRIFKGEVKIKDSKICSIKELPCEENQFILPGFIDAHIHIESSMLVPSEFAKVAVKHGTVATVSDPHEIANVLGVRGVEFMIENGKQVPFKFNFGAPSCVPATVFETAGAVISSDDIKVLLERSEIKYLSEMMNYPGVIQKDPEVLKKLEWAKQYKKPVDGHAPGLRGQALDQYIAAGINTDHECFSYDEALEKLKKGMKVLIREGSAAKNFDSLIDLLPDFYENIMFCSDDKHPDELLEGHINQLCSRAIAKGFDVFKVLQVACLNPINHYKLDVGQLRLGDSADIIVVEDLINFKTLQTYVNGEIVFNNGDCQISSVKFENLNNFQAKSKRVSEFSVAAEHSNLKVIECLNGELITNCLKEKATARDGLLVSNTQTDILKIAVVNRYSDKPPSIGFIKNFGLQEGAIASSVAHDSHNIIVVGVDDASICEAVNLIINCKGGISAVSQEKQMILPLPVAGIMSDKDAVSVGKAYSQLDLQAKKMGSKLNAPFMSLSFMGLLVIPALKMSDKGLFDASDFKFTSLQF